MLYLISLCSFNNYMSLCSVKYYSQKWHTLAWSLYWTNINQQIGVHARSSRNSLPRKAAIDTDLPIQHYLANWLKKNKVDAPSWHCCWRLIFTLELTFHMNILSGSLSQLVITRKTEGPCQCYYHCNFSCLYKVKTIKILWAYYENQCQFRDNLPRLSSYQYIGMNMLSGTQGDISLLT